MTHPLTTFQTSYRAPFLASAMLVLTLLQGSSFSLSLAFRGPLSSDGLIVLVTAAWVAMYLISAMALFVSFGMNWISWLVRYRLLLTLVLAGTAFSVAWSVDTALSLERSVHLIGTTIVALYLGFSLPLHRILRISAPVLGIIMLTSMLAALFVPALGLEEYQGRQVWTGTLASKNTLGFWAAISFLLSTSLSFWTITRLQRVLYMAIAAISLLCLYQAVSATALLALLSASLIMVYLHVSFSLRLGLIAALVLGALVASLLGMAFYFIDTAELIGRSGDLTGRAEVWSQTWQLILDRPWTGYGYGTLWYPTEDSLWIQQSLTDFSWTVFHAHNGLLQVASEIGLPLTLLVLLMIFQQLIEIIYCQYQRQQPGVLFVLGFVVALLVSNYSEARLLVNRELYWVFFIALPVSMLQQVSLKAAHTGGYPSPVQKSASDAMRLSEIRTRKEQKLQLKERMKKLTDLKVVNPSATANQNTPDSSSDTPDNSNHSTGKTRSLRARKNRQHKKAG